MSINLCKCGCGEEFIKKAWNQQYINPQHRRDHLKEEKKEYDKSYRGENKEKIDARVKEWVKENPERRKEIANKHARNIPNEIKNQKARDYNKTKKGFLVSKYSNMLGRIKGKDKRKAHLYEGMSIMPREEFYKWSLSDPEFNRLWEEWVASNFEVNLTPSIDRKVGLVGYLEWNVQWVTKRENDVDGLKSAKIMREMLGQINNQIK